MVPPYSHRVSRVLWYSGYCQRSFLFTYGAITLYRHSSQSVQLKNKATYSSPNPRKIAPSGLASSAFARHYLRNLGWFLFLALLRCFSSGGSLPTPIWFSAGWQSIALPGFPIRKSMNQSLFAAPHGLSQLVASFIGSQCQGIPLAPFTA